MIGLLREHTPAIPSIIEVVCLSVCQLIDDTCVDFILAMACFTSRILFIYLSRYPLHVIRSYYSGRLPGYPIVFQHEV